MNSCDCLWGLLRPLDQSTPHHPCRRVAVEDADASPVSPLPCGRSVAARKGAVNVYNADLRKKYRRSLSVPEKYPMIPLAGDSGRTGARPCMPSCRAEKSGERATTCCQICCRACCRSRPARVPLVAGSRAPVYCTGRRRASSSLLCWLQKRRFRRTLVRRASARGAPSRLSHALVAPSQRATICSREGMKESNASRRQSLMFKSTRLRAICQLPEPPGRDFLAEKGQRLSAR